LATVTTRLLLAAMQTQRQHNRPFGEDVGSDLFTFTVVKPTLSAETEVDKLGWIIHDDECVSVVVVVATGVVVVVVVVDVPLV